jgi:poly(hydroxyalkanoate) granule-associated protein
MNKTFTALIDRISNEQVLMRTRESARKIWLCGLGAYSLAADSSRRTVEALLSEGKTIPPRARRQIAEKSTELLNNASSTLRRGERLVNERFLQPLDYVLVATKRDVDALSVRIVQLSSEVRSLAAHKAKQMANPSREATMKPAAKPADQASAMVASAS